MVQEKMPKQQQWGWRGEEDFRRALGQKWSRPGEKLDAGSSTASRLHTWTLSAVLLLGFNCQSGHLLPMF